MTTGEATLRILDSAVANGCVQFCGTGTYDMSGPVDVLAEFVRDTTARADEAERMLYECIERAGNYAEGYAGKGLVRDVPGLDDWLKANRNRLANARRIVDLASEVASLREQLAKAERELAALTEANL